MKRIVLTAFVLLTAGAALYAHDDPQGVPPAAADPVKVTGSVTIPENGWATITGDGKTYTLMYPRYAASGIPIKNGENATVTGYVVPGPRWSDGKTLFLRVTEAEVGGKTYVIAGAGAGPRGGRGPGMMGPRGGADRDDDWDCYGGGRGPMMGGRGRW